jgi:hypothetical protein
VKLVVRGYIRSGYVALFSVLLSANNMTTMVENGTHVLFGTQMARYDTGENTLAKGVLPSL